MIIKVSARAQCSVHLQFAPTIFSQRLWELVGVVPAGTQSPL